MARLGKPDAAVTELEKAVVMNAAGSMAHLWLGYEYTAQSSFDKAADQMRIVVQQKPGDQDAWFALGRCYLKLGKRTAAELLHGMPDGARAWQLAAEQYEAQGNYGKALKLYTGALERRPNIPGLHEKTLALGGTASVTGHPHVEAHGEEDRLYALIHSYQAKARESFQRVAEIDPNSYRAHQVLGDSFAASDHFDDGVERRQRMVSVGECVQSRRRQPARMDHAIEMYKKTSDTLNGSGEVQRALDNRESPSKAEGKEDSPM